MFEKINYCEITVQKILKISGNNIHLIFDKNSENIYTKSIIELNADEEIINIKSDEDNNNKVKIHVGSKNKMQEISISADKLKIEGDIFSEIININSNGLISNAYIRSKIYNFKGNGLYLNNVLNSDKISLDSNGIKTSVEIENNQLFDIDANGVAGKIKFRDNLPTKMNLNCMGGLISLYMSEKKVFDINQPTKGTLVKKILIQ
ncbi:MAG: hypothetical protein PWP28_2604 [Oceanotoga sp.]|jgi:hypothetical protein|uniref:Uncharacterized protein n=1 Tax=Oceanotoga teriensis TaxID=515440 RepID=A0AA45HIK0_9BACT|nr:MULTISPECIES: hypothetical protein [Oceanotoga]MDN5343724.1 hypothetical protein [Oceanotoga sp.]PWJ92126.1 hypothetical protein C7380_1099 [Oceanotoga teriensis]